MFSLFFTTLSLFNTNTTALLLLYFSQLLYPLQCKVVEVRDLSTIELLRRHTALLHYFIVYISAKHVHTTVQCSKMQCSSPQFSEYSTAVLGTNVAHNLGNQIEESLKEKQIIGLLVPPY